MHLRGIHAEQQTQAKKKQLDIRKKRVTIVIGTDASIAREHRETIYIYIPYAKGLLGKKENKGKEK